jgi:hypothetical protein
LDLIAAGTSLATGALAPPLEELAAGVDADVELDAGAALEDALLLLLLLLPHAATSTRHAITSAANSGFLQVTIRLLLVCNPRLKRISISNETRRRARLNPVQTVD